MGKIELGEYLIPVADTGTTWVQTCEIPVIQSQLKIAVGRFTYLEFIPLGIKAGGWPNESIEIVEQRIRSQMIHGLKTAKNAETYQQLSHYFILHKKD